MFLTLISDVNICHIKRRWYLGGKVEVLDVDVIQPELGSLDFQDGETEYDRD